VGLVILLSNAILKLKISYLLKWPSLAEGKFIVFTPVLTMLLGATGVMILSHAIEANYSHPYCCLKFRKK